MAYELFYWPTIQGRGEYIRLALEEAGADYIDVAREKGHGRGVSAMMALMDARHNPHPSFAPPFLRDGELIIGQTAAILLYLGEKLGLAPKDEAGRLWTHQIQLTLADLVVEAHDAHHPIGSGFYYEDQKPEAQRRAVDFRETRMPLFLSWLEGVLNANPMGPDHLVGSHLTYADLSLFQVVEGLRYAFPKASRTAMSDFPKVEALHARVAERPHIKAYLASPRRLPFNEQDIFRHYEALDA